MDITDRVRWRKTNNSSVRSTFSVIETEIQNNANKTVNTSVVSMLCICAADGLKFCMPTQLHLFLIRCFGVEDDYTPSSETVRLVINI